MSRFGFRTNVLALVVAAGTVAAWASLSAWSADATVAYPAGYRSWVHVKSTLVGPKSPFYERNGGLHHFYANEKGMEGYRTGQFPDGSVLIDDLVEVKDNENGATTEGARRRVAVMLKDAARFRDTGGWGFEVFPGDGQAPVLDAVGRTACFTCHTKGRRDFVFSDFRQ